MLSLVACRSRRSRNHCSEVYEIFLVSQLRCRRGRKPVCPLNRQRNQVAPWIRLDRSTWGGGEGWEADCQIWRTEQRSLVWQEITQIWVWTSFIQTNRSTTLVWAPCGTSSNFSQFQVGHRLGTHLARVGWNLKKLKFSPNSSEVFHRLAITQLSVMKTCVTE